MGQDVGKELQVESIGDTPSMEVPSVTAETQTPPITELRKKFGLPERSPLLDKEAVASKKRIMIDELYEKGGENWIKLESGFVDRGKKKMMENRQKREMTAIDKFKRKAAIQMMKLRGLQNAEAYVKTLETKYQTVYGPWNYLQLARSKACENLKNLTPQELSEGMERVMTFGYLLDAYDFESEEFVSSIQKLARVEENKFQKACEDLNPYWFISDEHDAFIYKEKNGSLSKHIGLSANFQELMGILQNGGLNQAQRQNLERAKKQTILSGHIFLNLEVEDSDQERLTNILHPRIESRVLDDLIFLAEDDVFHQIEVKKEEHFPRTSFANFYLLFANSAVPYLKGLVEKGVDCSDIYKDIRSLWVKSPGELPQIISRIVRVFEFLGDEEKIAFVCCFSELLEPPKDNRIHDFDIRKYEAMWQEREKLLNLALILSVLPGINGQKIEEIVQINQLEGRLQFNWEELKNTLRGISVKNDSSLPEKSRAKILRTIAEPPWFNLLTDSGENLQFLVFIASCSEDEILKQNYFEGIDENSILTKTGLVEAFLEEKYGFRKDMANEALLKLTTRELAISPLLLMNLDVFSDDQVARIAQDAKEETITATTLSSQDRLFINQARKMTSSLACFAAKKRTQILDYFNENGPKPRFIREAIREATIDGHVTDSLYWITDEFLAHIPDEKQKAFWQLAKSVYPNEDQYHPFLDFMLSHEDDFENYLTLGKPNLKFFEGMMTVDKTQDKKYTRRFLSDEVIGEMNQRDQQFWRFQQKYSTVSLGEKLTVLLIKNREKFDEYSLNGEPTPALLYDLIKADASVYVSMLLYESSLNSFIFSFSIEEQPYWRFFQSAHASLLVPALVDKNLFELRDDKVFPKPEYFETAVKENKTSGVIELVLTDEVLKNFGKQEKKFWKFFRDFFGNSQYQTDFKTFVLDFVKKEDDFEKIYRATDEGQLSIAFLEKRFLDEIILTPEKISRWETLPLIFGSINRLNEPDQRALAYLRLAEGLTAVVTPRTEVEATTQLQTIFSNLYRAEMSDLERTAYFLLRRQLPFATEEHLRDEMKNQAVVVEQQNSEKLAWVHQAVHNYVRVTTPQYIRALLNWVKTGEEASLKELRVLAGFYSSEAQAPNYAEEDRLVLQNSIPEIEKLAELVSMFYETRWEKLEIAVSEIKQNFTGRVFPVLPENLISDFDVLVKLSKDIINQDEMSGNFILLSAQTRQKITNFISSSNNPNQKTSLLVLDLILSDLAKKAIPVYFDKYVKPRLKDAALTTEESFKTLQIVHAVFQHGFIEGENPDSVQTISSFSQFADIGKISKTSIRNSRLKIQIAQTEMNQDWGKFMDVARPEMIKMLVRMGVSEHEATARIYNNDLISFRKGSFSFYLEDLIPIAEQIMNLEEERFVEPFSKASTMYEKKEMNKFEGGNVGNETVRQYFDQLSLMKMPDSLQEANVFLSQLANSEDAHAERLTRIFISDYFDEGKMERKRTIIKSGKNIIEFYPYSIYGVDCVAILLNGKRQTNSFQFMKKRFETKIVPAMLHSFHEGD